MKAMTTKQAEKWLEKVKNSNPSSFREINKVLKRYEKSNDEYDCYVKLNTLLLEYPDLTGELNNHLDEGHRFVINKSRVERINDLVKYIKKIDAKAFNEIVKMITSLSNKRNANNEEIDEEEQNNLLINFVFEQVKENQELCAHANKALYYSAEELIHSLDLSYLKTNKQAEAPSKPEESYEVVRPIPMEKEDKVQVERYPRKFYPPFLNVNDEKNFLRQLELNTSPEILEEFIKVFEVYQLGIISKDETLEILKSHFNKIDFIAITDIIESRESSRRRNCAFRPLSDMDFSLADRASHSYVAMPQIYPHICSGNNKNENGILNIQWISVPRGSEDTFNIRVKNTNEENLIKAEDDRYEFDIFSLRLSKSIQIIDRMCAAKAEDPNVNLQRDQKMLLSLGMVQTVYKNSSREQKEEFEFYLSKMSLAVLSLFRQRLNNMKVDLQEIRNVHALRNWSETASKNFNKSLDIKGHEFKRIEKMKLKASVFLEELKKRVLYLKEGDLHEDEEDIFAESKKNVFQIFNSFQSSSRKEKCEKRSLPQPHRFQIQKNKNNTLLPAMIMAFEDGQALSLTYSIISYYLENSVVTEAEKNRCKSTLKYIMSQFFELESFELHYLSSSFNEESFFCMINESMQEEVESVKIEEWIHKEKEEAFVNEEGENQNPNLKVQQGEVSDYDYLPPKSDHNIIFYASENFYVFIRFLYTLYERVIRMKEILERPRQILLFEILYFVCLKFKESSKFEESLNNLFGFDYAYIFTTFSKLVENLCKSLNSVSLCSITSHSSKLLKMESEAAYIQLLNNYLLVNGLTATKIVRCAFDLPTKLLYINSLECWYNTEEQVKELPKRRSEITYKIDLYTVLPTALTEGKEEADNALVKNEAEYCFEGNSIKIVNLSNKEDIQVKKKKLNSESLWKEDVGRNLKLIMKLQ